MARYTSAYSSFTSRLNEVHILRRSAYLKERADPVNLRHEVNAFCRGAIVLLSGHLEAYIKEIGEVAINCICSKSVLRENIAAQFYYHLSKDIVDEIRGTSEPSKIAEKIFTFLQNDSIFWQRTGTFPISVPVDRFNTGFSNPSFDKIRAYFNRFGYSDYRSDIARIMQAHFAPTVNMVDHLVDTRNKIAHGDQTISKTPEDINDMIVIIKRYCMATDDAFARWCKSNLCAIR